MPESLCKIWGYRDCHAAEVSRFPWRGMFVKVTMIVRNTIRNRHAEYTLTLGIDTRRHVGLYDDATNMSFRKLVTAGFAVGVVITDNLLSRGNVAARKC